MNAEHGIRRILVCKKSDLVDGRLRQVQVGLKAILVASVNGTIVALDGHCKHMRAPLVTAGRRQGDTLTCTWHGWTYDLTTGTVVGKSAVSLARHDVEIRGEDVYVVLR